jgi:hypothetical protein
MEPVKDPAAATTSVWKYDLRVDDRVLVEMPCGAELLHVGNQTGASDRFTLWARVDTEAPNVAREILVRGTGHPAPDAPYVGSVVGALVWHVFDGGDRG